jgi:alkyldihydroxyacetonephosphate synthase
MTDAPVTDARAMIRDLSVRYPGRVSTTAPDRHAYARDLWPRGLLGIAEGRPDAHPPDAVVWPTSTAEVAAIVRAAAAAGVPIVPFGAGSGVCGGALAIGGGLVVDLKRMRRLVALDARGRTATFEAGILGSHLEHALNRRGYTMGHFPSSIMCSTFGGWLAARSAGQLSTRYGKIEDLVRGLELVDGRGEVHRIEGADDPDLAQLIVGSEGTLGIITRGTCTIVPLPEARRYRGWSLPRVSAGCEAIRRLLQRGLRPAAVRLYDELDSLLHRQHDARDEAPRPLSLDDGASAPGSAIDAWLALLRGDGSRRGIGALKRRALSAALGFPALLNQASRALVPLADRGCLLILGFEGEAGLCEAEAAAAEEELVRAGGRDLGTGPGERWLKKRYDVSFGMSKIFDAGAFVDTMEVAATWDRLLDVYHGVRAALSPLAFVMAHFSHAYPEGCSIYFTFAAQAGGALEAAHRYDQIWRAGLSAAHVAGATISHHHGVGLSKAPFMPAEHGEAMTIYRALKDALDPAGILNPGKMGL